MGCGWNSWWSWLAGSLASWLKLREVGCPFLLSDARGDYGAWWWASRRSEWRRWTTLLLRNGPAWRQSRRNVAWTFTFSVPSWCRWGPSMIQMARGWPLRLNALPMSACVRGWCIFVSWYTRQPTYRRLGRSGSAAFGGAVRRRDFIGDLEISVRGRSSISDGWCVVTGLIGVCGDPW